MVGRLTKAEARLGGERKKVFGYLGISQSAEKGEKRD